METSTASQHQSCPSASSSSFDLDAMTVTEPQYLKMEDVHTTPSPPSPVSIGDGHHSQTSPAPVIVHSKQAKKRKSWGQELPQPKTTLPPRKRAKTTDEKEQRRIERIKRNRAAAHNSRERKRQETENLAVLLARANAELDAYRKLHGPLPASVVLPEVQVVNDPHDHPTYSGSMTVYSQVDAESTPAPSLVDSRGSVDLGAISPASLDNDAATMQVHIKQEPTDVPFSATLAPSALDNPDVKPASPALPLLDPTQHSAAMLCDLQCRSSQAVASSSASNTILPCQPSASPASSPRWQAAAWWTTLFLRLMTMQFQACYTSILLALWTHSPSRMERLLQAATIRIQASRSRTSSTTLQSALLRSTAALAQLNAATGLATTVQGGVASLSDASLNGLTTSSMAVLRARAEAKRRQMDGRQVLKHSGVLHRQKHETQRKGEK